MIAWLQKLASTILIPAGLLSAPQVPLGQRKALDDEAAAIGLRRPNPSISLERQIRDLTLELDRLISSSTAVWVCQSCQVNSDPKFGIIVGLEQVEDIRQNSRVSQFPQILFWLLAHEMAHQVQFKVYGASLAALPPAERQVYEAQADILAGKFLLERLPINATEEENRAITEALRVAYDLGTEQYSPADHPSHDARLTAVRLGMAAGMQAKLRQRPEPDAQGSAMVLAQKIDIRPGEDVLPWSLRTARRATNQVLADIVNLVLVQEDFVFDTDPMHPLASYWLTYENRGQDLLNIDLEVLCVAAARQDRDDNQRWQWTSARNYQFPLPAGATYTVTGAVQWYGDNVLFPRIVAPPRPQALIHVERATAAGVSAQISTGRLPLPVAPRPIRRDIERIALIDLTNAVAEGFQNLRAGPGLKLGDVVDYPSRVSFPGALSTSVTIPEKGSDSQPSVSATLVRTASQAEASQAYDQAVAALREALPRPGPWKERVYARPSAYDASTYFEGRTTTVSVHRSKQEVLNRYSVTVNIRPPN